ncbi:crotonase/enoyl-CoA hydratase family protein [Patulibacter minatonensis]|uniref:crotonase/enoyl-CoA hydratase family protein n=1 Tax=Patulibacter minatonensis TaxID=298163 RepID=UPI00047DF2BB|nr:crotonase/enoyl-CoA hydratase family protein [Patulibacter minatonensis]
MTDQPVLVERRGAVLVITLNRPEQRNAVNKAMSDGIGAAIRELEDDPALVLAVLTGAGKGFCAGMDLAAFAKGELPYDPERGFAGMAQRRPTKPLIAAVEGFAVAGGLEIALCADLLVAARDAQLGIPETKRALVAAGGALRRLPERIPLGLAMEMALTGDPITAERGHQVGLVNVVAEPGGALDAALALADRIAQNGPLGLAASKRILQEQGDWTETEYWEKGGAIAGPVLFSEDAREGATAFKEKRAPVWSGR